MSCCHPKPLQYAVLSQAYSTMNFLQIYHQWQNLMRTNEQQFKTSLYFNKKGLVLADQPNDNESQFKLTVNQILKQVTIQKKHKQTVIWRSIFNECLEIEKDDSLKLGNTCISIFDIYPLIEQNSAPEKSKSLRKEKQHCRICFSDEETKEDPLLNFCKCSGSVKFIHLECYREWFMPKIRIYKEQRITYFQFHNIRCDLCKQTMPFSVKKNGMIYPVLDYKKDHRPTAQQLALDPLADLLDDSAFERNLMIDDRFDSEISINQALPPLENQNNHSLIVSENNSFLLAEAQRKQGKCIVFKSQKKNANNQTTIQIIAIEMVENESILFGSDIQRCHVLMGSGSASPLHAKIYLQENSIFLQDMGSLYGTFIQLRENKSQKFKGKKGIVLQHSQKQLLSLRVKPFIIPFLTISQQYRIMIESPKEKLK